MIVVVGERDGVEVMRFALAHGADPGRELLSRGWVPGEVAVSGRAPDVTLTVAVVPGLTLPGAEPAQGPGELRQRLAAYAVVVAPWEGRPHLLLTELSDNVVGGAGLWLLPGGGIDAGEEPGAAIVREVWEETGQVVDRVDLLRVMTSHRIEPGARPGERGVNFHAVRLVHVASCPRPSAPVVHDVGGSTASAAWVPTEDVARATSGGVLPDGRVLASWVHQLFCEDPDLLHPTAGSR